MTTDRHVVELEIEDGHLSTTAFHRIDDTLWTLSIRSSKDGKFLEVQCNSVEQHKYWNCFFFATIQTTDVEGDKQEELHEKTFSNYTTVASIMPIVGGVNRLIVTFHRRKMQIFNFPKAALFDEPVEHITDVTLKVEGQKLYACKKILATYSRHFYEIFFEKNKKCSVFDVRKSCNIFRVILNLIYSQNNFITVDNVAAVLRHSSFYSAKHCVDECEKFLIKVDKSAAWKMDVAKKYDFNVLHHHILSSLHTIVDVMNLVGTTKNYVLKPEVKIAFFDRMAEIENKGTPNPANGQFQQQSTSLTKKRTNLTDMVLSVDGKKFHVSKQLLAFHSSYFYTMFYSDFSEKGKKVIELNGINSEEFEIFLQFVHHPNRIYDKSTIESVLKLSQMYDAKIVIKNSVDFLRNEKDMSDVMKIELAEKYALPQLFDAIGSKIKTQNDYINLSKIDGFDRLSLETLGKISRYMLPQ